MEWNGSGVITSVKLHGETSAIVDVFTREKGRHSGIVRGGASRKMSAILQPGVQVEVAWRARLEEHLGSFKVEPIKMRSSILSDRLALAGLSSLTSLISFACAERQAYPDLYDETIVILDQMEQGELWLKPYALWELLLLEDLGFGLDLVSCAATGAQSDLIYVSPKSGRAVSKDGAGEWVSQMLPLPPFFLDTETYCSQQDLVDAFRTNGHFLASRLARALGDRPLPAARDRFIQRIKKLAKEEQQ